MRLSGVSVIFKWKKWLNEIDLLCAHISLDKTKKIVDKSVDLFLFLQVVESHISDP